MAEKEKQGTKDRKRVRHCKNITYRVVPSLALFVLVISVTAALVYSYDVDQPMPSRTVLVFSVLFAVFLVLFVFGLLILYAISRCSAAKDLEALQPSFSVLHTRRLETPNNYTLRNHLHRTPATRVRNASHGTAAELPGNPAGATMRDILPAMTREHDLRGTPQAQRSPLSSLQHQHQDIPAILQPGERRVTQPRSSAARLLRNQAPEQLVEHSIPAIPGWDSHDDRAALPRCGRYQAYTPGNQTDSSLAHSQHHSQRRQQSLQAHNVVVQHVLLPRGPPLAYKHCKAQTCSDSFENYANDDPPAPPPGYVFEDVYLATLSASKRRSPSCPTPSYQHQQTEKRRWQKPKQNSYQELDVASQSDQGQQLQDIRIRTRRDINVATTACCLPPSPTHIPSLHSASSAPGCGDDSSGDSGVSRLRGSDTTGREDDEVSSMGEEEALGPGHRR